MSEQPSLEIKDEKKLSTVEDYKFEPIKGYPMLQWKGKRPFTSTQFYPAQLKENHGDAVNGWMNRIFWGDNLQVMSHLLKEFRGKVDLVYIDPPFDSKVDYKMKIALRGKALKNDTSSFEEKQYADIWSNDTYLQFLFERLSLIRELLADTGVLFVHCDHHRSHLIRAILDEIFGNGGPEGKDAGYKSEIIWRRTSAHSDSKTFGQVHDTIFFYSKSSSFCWNSPLSDYDDWYVERYYRYTDTDGRKFKSGDLTAAGLSGGGYHYTWKGIVREWRCPETTMAALDAKGKIYYTENGIPRLKQYLEEMEGLPIQTLWDDIQPVVSWSTDATDYPTQKPAMLVARILHACSKPGDLILDCFMGSGTTQAVAMQSGRRFIGADINLGAIQTTTKRLLGIAEALKRRQEQGELKTGAGQGEIPAFHTGFSVSNVNHYDVFRNPAQAKDLLIEALEVQPLPNNTLYDGEKDGRMVKIMPINRISTKADINDLLTGFDYKAFQKRRESAPSKPVESLLLVCMGHEPDLAAHLKRECQGFDLDVEVVDILRDKANLEFKRDAQAEIKVENGVLKISAYYPMNLLQKLSLMKENVGDWRELTESVMIDWNYDGAVFEPKLVDVPEKEELVKGEYPVPDGAGTIRVKLTDLLSESLEAEVSRG